MKTHTLLYIKWYTTKGVNDLQSEGMVTLTNKQTLQRAHTHTLRSWEMDSCSNMPGPHSWNPSGAPNTTANISPAVIFCFLCLYFCKHAQEVAEGLLRLPGTARIHPILCLPPGARCWLRGKVTARWDPTCPLGEMKCKFCNVGSFAAVWSCLIGPDWRLIWLA